MILKPKQPNKTEDRLMNLIFNFYKHKNGLSFTKIRKIMKDYYHNENYESDHKKFLRDIEELQSLKIPINKHYPDYYEDEDPTIYWLDPKIVQNKIQFTDKELKYLSIIILKHYKEDSSIELKTAMQKIFSSKVELLPNIKQFVNLKNSANTKEKTETEKIEILLQAITNKTPIKIQYSKYLPEEIEERFIEPYFILKKNSDTFYLFAYDREKSAKRKFLVPKIHKIQLVLDNFISQNVFTEEDKNVNSLYFPKHPPTDLILETEPGKLWKLKIFLNDYPYKIEDHSVYLTTTNYISLFDFMWKENGVIIGVNSEQFLSDFKDYINKIRSFYE